jgi:DNA invertase Pin-like site-specific DNA recombinase
VLARDESIDGQNEICRKFASDHQLQVVDSFFDIGVSGMAKVRSGFSSLLNFLSNHKGEAITVVVASPCRIARDFELMNFYKEKLAAFGAKVMIANAPAEIQ